MDIKCKHCGEPWDMAELHDMLDETKDAVLPFKKARALFYRYGCGAFQNQPAEKCEHEPIESAATLANIDILQDLMGDDVDGLASMTEDFETVSIL